jgi:hypothetical protein
MMLFLPTACKEVCGNAVKLLYFPCCVHWVCLYMMNGLVWRVAIHSYTALGLQREWGDKQQQADLYLQPFHLNDPHSELETLRCISQTCCQVYTSNVAEGVYYFFSESISQWCEWWLNNEWTQPRSLAQRNI